MWRDYSRSYIRENRASSLSVTVSAFISALLLSLLCSVFYNFWVYEVEGVCAEEGGWHGRLTGEVSEEALAAIRNFSNVERVVVDQESPDGQMEVVDVYLRNMRTVLEDMPRIAGLAGLGPESVTYNYSLLNLYLIRDPEDPAPRMLFPFFLMVTAGACLSLILIIHNSFAVSMNARIHQFGILSSVGATPGQIRAGLLQEAAALCAAPVAAGNLLGVLSGMGVIALMNGLLKDVEGRKAGHWAYHPLVFVFTFGAAALTVLISAWLPAWKMSRLTPLQAIRNADGFQVKKTGRGSRGGLLKLLFGVEGELAGNALRAQKRALRTGTLALTFAFLAFTVMQCFFVLSGISQRMTYFARYQDVWDIMAVLKDTDLEEVDAVKALQELSGIRSCVVYQKAAAKTLLKEEELSEEFLGLGGFRDAPENDVQAWEEAWMVNAPLLILDDAGFLEYCGQIGAPLRLDGAVVVNRIADFTDPDFRDREKLPYLNESGGAAALCPAENPESRVELPILCYGRELPVLREEYGTLDYYELVHVLPLSLWKDLKEQTGGAEEDTFIRIIAGENADLENLNELEGQVRRMIGQDYDLETENRIQDKIDNDQMIDGMMLIFGGFCVLLAIIGIGSVFSNTLGFARQRRREVARCLSVGMTPGGVWKMFCAEALVIAGKPVLITLPATVLLVWFMIRASYLDPSVFIREAPVLPVGVFFAVIFGSVALAYYLGGRKVLRCGLAEMLRDDTMV